METSHDGHRQRLRSKILTDPESLQPHEVVEYLLFPVIPRRDLNPLAHALLKQFGSIRSLFLATVEELMQVEGVSCVTAEYLQLLGAALTEYAESPEVHIFLRNRADARRFLQQFYLRHGVDGCWLLCLNSAGLILRLVPLDESPVWHATANMHKAIHAALDCGAHSLLIARRIPRCILDTHDVNVTMQLVEALKECHIQLLEHIVLDPSGDHVRYATNPALYTEVAEPSSLASHWLDEP